MYIQLCFVSRECPDFSLFSARLCASSPSFFLDRNWSGFVAIPDSVQKVKINEKEAGNRGYKTRSTTFFKREGSSLVLCV